MRGAGVVGPGPILLDALEARLGGRPEDDVLLLDGGFRALLRARLCVAHLLDAAVRDPEKWKSQALSYIAIASGDPTRAAPFSRQVAMKNSSLMSLSLADEPGSPASPWRT